MWLSAAASALILQFHEKFVYTILLSFEEGADNSSMNRFFSLPTYSAKERQSLTRGLENNSNALFFFLFLQAIGLP